MTKNFIKTKLRFVKFLKGVFELWKPEKPETFLEGSFLIFFLFFFPFLFFHSSLLSLGSPSLHTVAGNQASSGQDSASTYFGKSTPVTCDQPPLRSWPRIASSSWASSREPRRHALQSLRPHQALIRWLEARGQHTDHTSFVAR